MTKVSFLRQRGGAVAPGTAVTRQPCGQGHRRLEEKVSAGVAPAQAQQAALKLMVGFPPGGSGDTFARLIAEQLRNELGTVVVENREGAGGIEEQDIPDP